MAKTNSKNQTKTPGRFKQLLSIYALTIKTDKAALAWSLLGLLGPIAIGVIVGQIVSPNNAIGSVLWVLLGLSVGVLVAMIILSNRGKAAAYMQAEGRPGVAGQILATSLRRGWRTSEQPVHWAAKTQEFVWRAIGPSGVVLLGEGSSRARVQAMVEDERRKVARIAPGVPIHIVYVVAGDERSVPLAKLVNTVLKFKRALNRAEVAAVGNRLDSIGMNIPVPKGIDPNRVRMPRQR